MHPLRAVMMAVCRSHPARPIPAGLFASQRCSFSVRGLWLSGQWVLGTGSAGDTETGADGLPWTSLPKMSRTRRVSGPSGDGGTFPPHEKTSRRGSVSSRCEVVVARAVTRSPVQVDPRGRSLAAPYGENIPGASPTPNFRARGSTDIVVNGQSIEAPKAARASSSSPSMTMSSRRRSSHESRSTRYMISRARARDVPPGA